MGAEGAKGFTMIGAQPFGESVGTVGAVRQVDMRVRGKSVRASVTHILQLPDPVILKSLDRAFRMTPTYPQKKASKQ